MAHQTPPVRASGVGGNPHAPNAGRASQPRPHEVDGELYCRRCLDDRQQLVPNDPEHPRSAYCAEHRQIVNAEHRAASKRRRKEREGSISFAKQIERGIYIAPDGAAILNPDATDELRSELADLDETITEAREAIELAVESGSIEMIRIAALEAVAEAGTYTQLWSRLLARPRKRPGRPAHKDAAD